MPLLLLFFRAFSYDSIRQDIRFRKKSMTSSDSVCKFMLCRSNSSVPDLVNHQYCICICIPKKIHRIFVLLFLAFILESE